MCTFSVFRENQAGDDANKYQRGYVVAIYEDGRITEPPSPNSKVYFVHAPGVPVADAAEFIEPKRQGVRRRNWFFDYSRLNSQQQQRLFSEYQLTLAQPNRWRSYFRNLDTGETAEARGGGA